MGLRYLTRRGPTSLARDLRYLAKGGANPLSATWANNVIAAGGTVSNAARTRIETLLKNLQAAGVLPLMADLWLAKGAENVTQATTSLLQGLRGTLTSGATWDATGLHFDGVTGTLRTKFFVGSSGARTGMIFNDIRLAVRESTLTSSTGMAAGSQNDQARALFVRPRHTTTTQAMGAGNSQTGTFTLATSTSISVTAVQRLGNVVSMTQDGAALAVVTGPVSVGPSLPPNELWLGGSDNANALVNPRACVVGYCSIGRALSGAQAVSEANIINALIGP